MRGPVNKIKTPLYASTSHNLYVTQVVLTSYTVRTCLCYKKRKGVMICIGIRWCRIVPNGREREREACVHIIFKIEKELKPRVPPPLFLYIRRCLFFFILLLFGRVLMLVCVYPPIFSLLLCVCVDGDPPLVLPWRYYFRPFHPCAFKSGPIVWRFRFPV
jgi:hypothetical protein